MQERTVYGKKEGHLCTVYLDGSTNQPISVRDIDDEPEGAFAWAASEGEVRAAFKGYNIVFHEKVCPPPPDCTNEDVSSQLDEYIGKLERGLPGLKVEKREAEKLIEYVPPKLADEKVVNYIKRLEYALEYAAPKNKAVLSLKIETAKEILKELNG